MDNEQQILQQIQEWQEQGFTEDQIDQKLSELGLIEQDDNINYQQGNVTVKMPDMNFDLSNYVSPFDEEPPKPKFFKGKDQIKPNKSKFLLKSKQKYILNGEERFVRKLSIRDIMRLVSKTQAWALYLGYNTPQMLVDEFSGRYRFMETLMKLFERAFSDYDEELDSPTEFSYSVVEEIARLLNIKQQGDIEPAEYLLDYCDPEEVYDAVARLVEYNQVFFARLWNNPMLGRIRSLFSSISGMISSKSSILNELQSLNKSEESQSQNNE